MMPLSVRAAFFFLLTIVALGCTAERAIPLGDAVVLSGTTDGGAAPSVAIAPDGRRMVSWVSGDAGENRIYVSVDGLAPAVVPDTLGMIQNHPEAPPRLVVDQRGTLYLLYVVTRDAGRRFPLSALRFRRSLDGGGTWTSPVTVTRDTADFGSHNFHALAVSPDGAIYASWIDGRDGASAIYFKASRDGGVSWGVDTRISVGETCPCCRTAIAAGKDGVVHVAWRTVLPGSYRDIVVATSTDYATTFREPVRVHADNWEYSGCPHAGPSIQVDTRQRLHVLWWTGKVDGAGVYFASSDDGAQTFSPPVTIAKHVMPTHVQLGVEGSGNDILALWDEMTPSSSTITARLSTDAGKTFGRSVFVSDSMHVSMHPSLSVREGTGYVAWTRSAHSASHQGGHGHGAGPAKVSSQVLAREIRF